MVFVIAPVPVNDPDVVEFSSTAALIESSDRCALPAYCVSPVSSVVNFQSIGVDALKISNRSALDLTSTEFSVFNSEVNPSNAMLNDFLRDSCVAHPPILSLCTVSASSFDIERLQEVARPTTSPSTYRRRLVPFITVSVIGNLFRL